MWPVESFVGFLGGLALRGASGTAGTLAVCQIAQTKKTRAVIPWPCDALMGGAVPVLVGSMLSLLL